MLQNAIVYNKSVLNDNITDGRSSAHAKSRERESLENEITL